MVERLVFGLMFFIFERHLSFEVGCYKGNYNEGSSTPWLSFQSRVNSNLPEVSMMAK